jgi:hypothetical protein
MLFLTFSALRLAASLPIRSFTLDFCSSLVGLTIMLWAVVQITSCNLAMESARFDAASLVAELEIRSEGGGALKYGWRMF